MHFHDLPFSVLALLFLQTHHTIAASVDFPSLDDLFSASSFSPQIKARDDTAYDQNPNGSFFVWLPQDEYSGDTFFDRFNFFADIDPTHYVNKSFALDNGLAYVQDGTVFMKGDDTTWLADGEFRNSVRISSISQYNTGLFILDINRAPWGCAIWPAWWTVGGGQWPFTGEIDILEGVHDNEHNQVTWHTGPDCFLTPESNFTGAVVQSNGQNNTNCDGTIPPNAGCGVQEWSRASYGEDFNLQGGGVFAMKWDENGIAVWSFFRAAVPADIVRGTPNPSQWGSPVAALEPGGCDPIKNFVNHSIVFDITFCGDWAGNSYATSGCPGTCADRLKDPSNFENASWSINYMKVYKKQPIFAIVRDSNNAIAIAPHELMSATLGRVLVVAVVSVILGLLVL
ncbi:hypothetical protein K435DRAFT_661045 [Dendrothele bispora CBS 962.96]|uniref:GH16 domain-containing protein n=1 Tax=Dendrothele bispora (strain CBS 962.96) TaxID=1314807 RepID=A0A4S8M908_DENBC|nr:hypothetical protein K435DRAFT_661045 [Dendrothele bispora CBS 962.96]